MLSIRSSAVVRNTFSCALLIVVLASRSLAGTTPVGTAFTYQGQLKQGGEPVDDTADFRFTLFDVASDGSPVSATMAMNSVAIVEGIFTVDLDFDAGAFASDARWLDISVRSPAGSGVFTTLSPRQRITSTPVAQFALNANGAVITNLNASNITSGTLPNAVLSGAYSGGVNFSNPGNTFVGAFSGSGASIVNLNASNIATGTLPVARGGTGATAAAAALANLGGVDSVIAGKNMNGGGTAGDVTLNLNNSVQLGSGTAPLTFGALTVFNGATAQESIELLGNAHRISTYGSDGLEQVRLWGATFGEILLNDNTGNNTTVLITATSNSGGEMQLRDAVGGNTIHAVGGTGTINATGGFHVVPSIGGTPHARMINESWGGRLYTQDEAGLNTALIGSSTTAGGFQYLYQSDGNTVGLDIDGDASGAGGGGHILMRQADGSTGVILDGDNNDANGGGAISINNNAASTKVRLLGQSVASSGEISVFDNDGTEVIEILGAETTTTGGQIVLRNAAGVSQIELDSEFGVAGDPGRIVTPNLQTTQGNGIYLVEGNVGIGVSNPGFALHLSTNSAAKPTSNTWTISSDKRLKKNINTIDHALDDLLSLRGVTYQWNDPASQGDMDGTYTGMIAQEVERVFPEWIHEDANGFKTLTVIGFEGIVVEALRELRVEKDAQIESLRRQKDAEITDLRERLDAVEAVLAQSLAGSQKAATP